MADAAGGAPAAPREDMLANAVSFLTHDKVRGSPEAHKRAFLLQKGLTEAEIDEAFRRVPEPAGAAGGGLAAPPATAATTAQALAQAGGASGAVAPMPHMPREPMTWGRMAFYGASSAAALAAASAGAAALWRSYVLPRLADALGAEEAKGARAAAEEAAQAAKEAVAAVERNAEERSAQLDATASVLEAQAVELREALDAVREIGAVGMGGGAGAEGGALTVGDLRAEMSSLMTTIASMQTSAAATANAKSDAIRSLEAELAAVKEALDDRTLSVSERVQMLERLAAAEREDKARAKGKAAASADADAVVQSLQASPAAPAASAPAPTPGGDAAPWSPSSASSHAARTRAPAATSRASADAKGKEQAPRPASYGEVMEMVARGETPPGIAEVDDTPPDPTAAPTEPQVSADKPRAHGRGGDRAATRAQVQPRRRRRHGAHARIAMT